MAHVSLRNVEIAFVPTHAQNQSLKRAILNVLRGRISRASSAQTVHALQNVTITLSTGDRVALLGRNGAGKSTLLRVLGGVYEPFSGHVEVNGRVASLLGLGLGFFADLNGLQNIVTSSLFYGATLDEARAKSEEIAAFTELGDALQRPVRTYSAGMQMRLAFGIATAYEPEILLLDEVVGVGDKAFAERAQARIMSLAHTAEILVLASHDESALKRFCNRGIVLDQGRVIFDGELDAAIAHYHERLK